MPATVIEAEHEGKCGICGQRYPIGTRIAHDKQTGRWAMADCIWPGRKGLGKDDPTPKGAKGKGGTSAARNAPARVTAPQEEPPEYTAEPVDREEVKAEAKVEVAERLDEAVDLLCRKFSLKPEEVKPDSPALAEVMHELYGQEWMSREWR